MTGDAVYNEQNYFAKTLICVFHGSDGFDAALMA